MKVGSLRAIALGSCVLLLAAAPEQSPLRNVKLSGPFLVPPTVTGSILEFQISASTGRVVYRGDQDVDNRFELFSVPIDGSAGPVRLHPALSQLLSWSLSPDGSRVLLLGRLASDAQTSVYAIPADGSSAPIDLSGTVGALVYSVSPDGAHVLFAPSAGDALYSVPIDGSTSPLQISAPLAQGTFVGSTNFEVSPDGVHAVYLVMLDWLSGSPYFELYSTTIDGSAPAVKLNDGLPPGGSVVSSLFTPNGARVIYRASQDAAGVFELFSVPVDRSASPTKLNGPLVANGDVQANSGSQRGFAIAPDGTRVVYLADQDIDERFELYSVPVDASAAPVKLSGVLPAAGDVQPDFQISSDSARVVYRADANLDEVFQLYSVPLDGSASPIALHTPLGAGQTVRSDVELSPDGTRAVYRVDVDLFAVRIDGSAAPVKLDPPLVPGAGVVSHQVSPGSDRVAYAANQDTLGIVELFSAPIDGSASSVKVSGVFGPGNGLSRMIWSFAFDPSSTRIAYRANQDSDVAVELYGTPADGSALALKLNGPLPLGPHPGDVASFTPGPDGKRVLYTADQDKDEQFELYSAPLDGESVAVKLNATLIAGGDVSPELRFTPSGARVVYRADQDVDELFELYSVPSDGSAPPVKLSGTMVAGGDVQASSYSVSPNGQRVIYQADQDSDEVIELYSAPIDGSAPPVKLNGPLPAGGDVVASQIAPSGARVVYIADQSTNDVFELFSVPTDGSAAPTKLNGAFGPSADVQSIVGIAQGRVVYLADPDTDNHFELYSAPLLGTSSPVKLNGIVGQIQHASISPDGARVLFLAQATTPVQLFSAPIAGGASAVRLNGPLVSGGEVSSYALTADGQRVAYVADQSTDNVRELYVVPTDGSAPAVKIPGTQGAGSGFTHTIAPDGSRVVYQGRVSGISSIYSVPMNGSSLPLRLSGSTLDTSSFFLLASSGKKVVYQTVPPTFHPLELFVVPTDGTAAPVRLHHELVAGGDVSQFDVSPDGSRAIYMADQETDTIVELFSAALSRQAARAAPPGATVQRQVP